jgi:hypothetical protein
MRWTKSKKARTWTPDFLKAFGGNSAEVSLKEGDQVSKDVDVSLSARAVGTAQRRP